MTNNAERELLPCPFCGGKPVLMANSVVECRNCPIGKYSGYASANITAWQARAQASGVPDFLTLPVSIRGKLFEVPVPVQVHLVLLEMKLKELSTPPKSASVPVGRLEALQRFAVTDLADVVIGDEGGQWIDADELAELIAEYK